jgi:hypothetical protein
VVVLSTVLDLLHAPRAASAEGKDEPTCAGVLFLGTSADRRLLVQLLGVSAGLQPGSTAMHGLIRHNLFLTRQPQGQDAVAAGRWLEDCQKRLLCCMRAQELMPSREAEDSDGGAHTGGGQLKAWIAGLGKRGKPEDPEVLKVGPFHCIGKAMLHAIASGSAAPPWFICCTSQQSPKSVSQTPVLPEAGRVRPECAQAPSCQQSWVWS